MRIRNLSGQGSRPWVVELHPQITVVHALEAELAKPIRKLIVALVKGEMTAKQMADAGLSGEVEVNGEMAALEQILKTSKTPKSSTIALHDEGSVALLSARRNSIDAALSDARKELAAAQREVSELKASMADDRDSRDWNERAAAAAVLREARRRLAEAVAATALAEADEILTVPPAEDHELAELAAERINSARSALDAAVASREDAVDHYALLESNASALNDELRTELAELEERCRTSPPTPALSESEIAAIQIKRDELVKESSSLLRRPTSRVSVALSAVARYGYIDADNAKQLAGEWQRVRALVDHSGADEAVADLANDDGEDDNEVRTKLAEARRVLADARRQLSALDGDALGDDDIAALEVAHAEVLEAWDGSDRRIGVSKARRRLEDAQLAEREILRRLGFASYTEFMVSSRSSGTRSNAESEEARRAVSVASAKVSKLEREYAEIGGGPDSLSGADDVARAEAGREWDPEAARGRLTASLASLRAKAVDLLGEDPGADVANSLNDRVSSDPLPELRAALKEVGVDLEETERPKVVEVAGEWVMKARADAGRRREIEAIRSDLEDQLALHAAAQRVHAEWTRLAARRNSLRGRAVSAKDASDALEQAKDRVVRDRDEVIRADAALAEAEEDARSATPMPLVASAGRASLPMVDLNALEGEARDAQTALDSAVAQLLPSRAPDDFNFLARSEARVTIARLELQALEAATADLPIDIAPAVVDPDDLSWRAMTALARGRNTDSEVGAMPLVLEDPFGDMTPAGAQSVCTALIGPSQLTQIVIFTERRDVAEWARNAGESVGLLTAAAESVPGA